MKDPRIQGLLKHFPEYFEKPTSADSKDAQNKVEESTNIHEVPFAARGNSIELSVANNTKKDFTDLDIVSANVPEWLQMETKKHIPKLSSGSASIAIFTFHILEEAPIGKIADLSFSVSTSDGFLWSRDIRLKIMPPSSFELDQNYPNPFNPATTIRYRLPATMKVTVNVYNILGHKVMTLVDGLQQEAGQQTLRFEGSRLASGVYFFRITARAQGGQPVTRLRKMTLIK